MHDIGGPFRRMNEGKRTRMMCKQKNHHHHHKRQKTRKKNTKAGASFFPLYVVSHQLPDKQVDDASLYCHVGKIAIWCSIMQAGCLSLCCPLQVFMQVITCLQWNVAICDYSNNSHVLTKVFGEGRGVVLVQMICVREIDLVLYILDVRVCFSRPATTCSCVQVLIHVLLVILPLYGTVHLSLLSYTSGRFDVGHNLSVCFYQSMVTNHFYQLMRQTIFMTTLT